MNPLSPGGASINSRAYHNSSHSLISDTSSLELPREHVSTSNRTIDAIIEETSSEESS